MSNQEERASSLFLVLLLFIGAGALFYLSSRSPSGQSNNKLEKSPTSEEVESIVNKHLQETAHKIEIEKLKRKIENDFSTPRVGQSIPLETKDPRKALNAELPEDRNQEALHDSFATQKEVDYSSPTGVIQRELADKQNQEEYLKRYKEAYIEQFVANAKRHGWKVEVDKNGVIKKAYQVESPSDASDQSENFMDPTAQSSH